MKKKMNHAGVTMDVYGALESVDINSMEQAFLSLQRNNYVPTLGTSYQCIRCIVKDLANLLSIFDSIYSYYSRA
ncbi:hypothetical protein M378DRAFT_11093 [Amanita muscaria Koide BX008]|uniref:Uncharacterized protein n=1 Tax=Amanita muscaria (strain Koide BX008) TaxID=946122 RepID=A0A0C2TDS5_AMAMK|nr:hypothetical protein M378DRAFT_11093 [Amanita muscaria Koide BX008]